MPKRAESKTFQAVVREVAALCGADPRPLTQRTSRLQWSEARRNRGQIPRTHLGGVGLPEYPEVEDVAESLRQKPRIRFSWE